MQRRERLAEIVDILRDGRLHLARDLAAALGVSLRTIYRDIDRLNASGVPIEGARGLGYLLREPVFLPPMALSLIELEALNLGMAIVQEAADLELQQAAQSVLSKVEEHASNRRDAPKSWGFGVYAFEQAKRGFVHMPLLRQAIRERLVLRLGYRALDGALSERNIRPLQIEYWGKVWTCTAWCERRADFRVFRVDRIEACAATGATFTSEVGKTLEDYLRSLSSS